MELEGTMRPLNLVLTRPLLTALIEFRSDRHWAWMFRRKVIDAVIRGLLEPSAAAAFVRDQIAVAQRLGRNAGRRVRWSVALNDGRMLTESTWADPSAS